MTQIREFEVTLSDGATLCCTATGQGIPVLWISGLSGVGDFWDTICPSLDGVMSIAFDQRGLRQSKRGSYDVSIDRLALDAMAILDHLALDKAHVVGHSTGGCIAMSMALTAPERISSLVLSGSWAGPNIYMSALFDWRLKLLETDARLYGTIVPMLSSTPKWLIDNPDLLTAPTEPWSIEQVTVVKERIDALMVFDRRKDIAELAQPCLVIGARDDVVVPVFLQEELAEQIPDANSYFFEHGGHFFPKSQNSQFISLMANWFISHRSS